MFLPIGDSPNPPGRPWVTWTLIAFNVLIYVSLLPAHFAAADPSSPAAFEYLQTLAEERGVQPRVVRVIDLVNYHFGVKPGDFSLLDAFTSMFLHGGFMHLAGNMLFLFIYGDNVEHRLGRRNFLLAYLATGFAAVLGDAVLRAGSSIPSIGASGAISGVLGFYFAWFPHNRVRLWAFLFPFYIGTLELPARVVLAMYVLLDNVLPLLISGGAGGVSYGAHLGGFVAGVGAALVLGRERPRVEGPRRRPDLKRDLGSPGDAVHQALVEGDAANAARIFFQLPRRTTARSVMASDKLALGENLELRGEPRLALAAYQRVLADHPAAPHRSAAHLGAARVLMRGLRSPTAAYQHLYAVLEEGSNPSDIAAARRLLAELRGATRHLPRRFLD